MIITAYQVQFAPGIAFGYILQFVLSSLSGLCYVSVVKGTV